MAKLHTWQDDFNDNSLNSLYSAPSPVAETGGQLVMNIPNGDVRTVYVHTGDGSTIQEFDIEESSYTLQMVSYYQSASFFIEMGIYPTSSDEWAGIWRLEGTTVSADLWDANLGDYDTGYSATYNSSTHKWFRFRETSGTLYMEYAGVDGIWHVAHSQDVSAFTNLNIANFYWYGFNSFTGATRSFTIDNLNVNAPLVVDSATHSHSVDNLSLPQHFTTGASIYGGWGSGFPGIVYYGTGSNVTFADTLQINSIPLGHTADNVTLIEDFLGVVQDSTHAHTADNVALTQKHTLVVDDAIHAHTAESVVVTETEMMVAEATLHDHTVDSVVLTQKHVLAIQDALHAHAADNAVLTQKHTVALQDASHSHTVEVVALTQKHFLVLFDTLHAHTADSTSVVFQIGIGEGAETGVYQPEVIVVGAVSAAEDGVTEVYQPAGFSEDEFTPSSIETGSWTPL